MRLLVAGFAQYSGTSAMGKDAWCVGVNRWIPDDPDDDETLGGATGEPLITCAMPKRPSAAEIADLLHRVEKESGLLATGAATPEGSVLVGTDYIVTERYEV
ncbi:hypothetical protein [Embleya sp. NPDC059237]|uniref:hypothetical protein n=1 Tax=Embleya sp. NPDC059237 TaxID=3346784 RepID=UPI003691ADC8